MFIIIRQRAPTSGLRLFIAGASKLRFVSSDRGNNKELDDKILNQWKEGIQKREELKKTLESEERSRFIENKKRELGESQKKTALLEQLVKDEKLNIGKSKQEPGIEQPKDELKISGSYQDLMKKIKENENFQQLKEELKNYGGSASEKTKLTADHLAERLKHNAEELKRAFPIVLKIINDLTGYTKVENLKQDILLKEATKEELKSELIVAKANYNKSIELRSMSQKQVNELLQRQNSWSLQDLERFTELYKNDHILEKQEQENLQILQELEQKKDENDEKLTTSILTRYHEEQIWSDKIRKFSTWGTILIMGVNLVLFVLVQLVFEPFKRRRLVNAFEIKVKDMLEQHKGLFPATEITIAETTEPLLTVPLQTEPNEKDESIQELVYDKVIFTMPEFDKNNIRKFITEFFGNIKSNFVKMFGTHTSTLMIDKIQFEVLLGLGLFLSFSFGLIF